MSLSPTSAIAVTILGAALAAAATAQPVLLDDRFELPPGFHIYRAASPEVTGGSYDIAFDGEGRLLVGDGTAVRRLEDADNDGVYDRFEVIATGLGGRGPQGLLVWGDRLYAVGGDGLQVFDEYSTGRPVHRGRLGATFGTGGDHDLHTVFRGYDGAVYLMAGNGAGIKDRRHITEATSPRPREREASVFRLDPDGKRWECLASGGRNPPSLAMHFTGELFSFDSDMEWHVGLPWYKPVRLNHWAIGSDQGWQEVGAYPSYFIDCVPHVVAVGRGSPNWGVFYEHTQFPGRYRHAFLVCDYRWKGESNDRYATPGRLVVFFLERDGAGWKATSETLARPKPGAREPNDRPVNFALVDVEVAPDGSLIISDHNQGLWRIFYDSQTAPAVPALTRTRVPPPPDKPAALQRLLDQPQPLAEWSRLEAEKIRMAFEGSLVADLKSTALDRTRPIDHRIRAIQVLAPGLVVTKDPWIETLALEDQAEVRGLAAWLAGLRDGPESTSLLLGLINETDPMVRRRAAEGLTRVRSPNVLPALIDRLSDPSRLTRLIAMNALAHHPTEKWLADALARRTPQTTMRALVAAHSSGHAIPPGTLHSILRRLVADVAQSTSAEDRLDLMRVLAMFEQEVVLEPETYAAIVHFLASEFPSSHRDVRWEQVRLLRLFGVDSSFGKLLGALESEKDEPTQFHIAQALARLRGGWTATEEDRAVTWFVGTQRGWFAEFGSKGVEFPQFWGTAVSEFCSHHPEAVERQAGHIDVTSLLGGAFMDIIAAVSRSGPRLIELYRQQTITAAQVRVAKALGRVVAPEVAPFLRGEIGRIVAPEVRHALWQSLAAHPVELANASLLALGVAVAPPGVARDCAAALASRPMLPDAALAEACLEHVAAGTEAFHASEKLLAVMSGKQRGGSAVPRGEARRPNQQTRDSALAFWSAWFKENFDRPFVARLGSATIKSDEQVRLLLLSDDVSGGDPSRGAAVYEALGCHACHGGGSTPLPGGHLFGPDLAGVTRRLTSAEFAEALAFPSKLVADRFKAHQLEKRDGTVLVGFVTEKNADMVTFAEAGQIHRIAQSEISRLAPQESSLMPEHLLNPLSQNQIRDLVSFIENIGVAPPGEAGK
jgi:putative heme-binding domain-containing protein